MNIERIKNTLREFQAENRRKFKNTQAELKKAVSYIKKVYICCNQLYIFIYIYILTIYIISMQKFKHQKKSATHHPQTK